MFLPTLSTLLYVLLEAKIRRWNENLLFTVSEAFSYDVNMNLRTAQVIYFKKILT